MVAPWVTYADLPAPLPTLPGGEAAWDAPIALASEVLWALSGRQWAGTAERTVLVVAPAAADPIPSGWDLSWGTAMHPAVVEGEIVNHSRCPAPALLRLPGDPVRVTSVVGRPAGSYRLEGAYLRDLSGHGWPVCEPGVEVTYDSGRPPPAGGKVAAAVLAREFGRSLIGDPGCALPGNVTAVTRQGISQSFVPASQIIALGQTGVPSVDAWIATVNPSRLSRRARAWSPDTATRSHRRTP